jgi:hypothetical protein
MDYSLSVQMLVSFKQFPHGLQWLLIRVSTAKETCFVSLSAYLKKRMKIKAGTDIFGRSHVFILLCWIFCLKSLLS